MHIKITDMNLVDELKNRNALALEYLMNKFGGALYSLAKRILGSLGSAEDIEECVSDSFAEAWESISKFDEKKGSFKTWLFIITKYKALDYRRKLAGRLKEEPVEEDYRDTQESIEEGYLVKEQVEQVVDAVKCFEEDNRSIFYRRYFFYESINSIARGMGLTEGAVYKRLWRVKNQLRNMVGWEGDGYGKQQR